MCALMDQIMILSGYGLSPVPRPDIGLTNNCLSSVAHFETNAKDDIFKIQFILKISAAKGGEHLVLILVWLSDLQSLDIADKPPGTNSQQLFPGASFYSEKLAKPASELVYG